MVVKEKAQVGMDDRWIEDPELEELLEAREALKVYNGSYKDADKKAKARVMELADKGQLDTPARCGRFVLEKKTTEPSSRAFDVAGGTRVSIGLADA